MRSRRTTLIRPLGIALAVGVLLGGTAVPMAVADADSDGWIEVVSPNLRLVTNAERERAVGMLQSLEAQRATVLELFTGRQKRVSLPTTIVLFADTPSYAPYRLAEREGQFLPTTYESLVVLNGGSRLRPASLAAAHEYVHALMAEEGRRMPLWLHEGLAEYFSTFRLYDDRVVVGGAVPGHRSTLRNRAFLPFSELAKVSGRSPRYHGESGGRFYAQAWLTVHYFMSDPVRVGRLLALADDPVTADSSETTTGSIFGESPEELDRALRQYLNRPTLPSFVRPQVADQWPLEIRSRTLTEGELAYRLGIVALEQARWSGATERFTFARGLFETAVALRPDDGDAHAGLARLEAALDRPDPAAEAYERAIFLDALEARSYADYGEFLLRRADEGSEPVRERQRAVDMLQRALDLEPGHDRLKARLDGLVVGSPAGSSRSAGGPSKPRR